MHKKIDSGEGLFGRVLNVFDKAINVRTNDDRLAVVTLGQVASPITVNVVPSRSAATRRTFTNLAENGDHVFVVRECSSEIAGPAHMMLGGKCAILIDKPVQFENQILIPNLGNLEKFLSCRDYLVGVLRECAKEKVGSLLNPDATTEGLLSEFMNLIRDHPADVSTPEFEVALSSSLLGLCGRGPGFTPAGDDFIAGVLAVFNWIRSGLNLGAPIIPGSEYRRLTTWTSFKLMECNSQGLVDAEVQELMNAIANGDVSRYSDLARWISKRGHTSGVDFVTGTTTAIYLLIHRISA
jgi:hypothetical protein